MQIICAPVASIQMVMIAMHSPIAFSSIDSLYLVDTPISAYQTKRLSMAQINTLVRAITLVKTGTFTIFFFGITAALATY
jgi:hypothetical protein